jgi:hypothetical protein
VGVGHLGVGAHVRSRNPRWNDSAIRVDGIDVFIYIERERDR